MRLRGTLRELDEQNLRGYADDKERSPLAGEAKPLERAAKNLGAINNEMQAVRRDPNLTPAEKRQKLEPPRTCLQCDRRLADGRCQAAARGEFHQRPAHYRPTADHPRRCIHYAPGHHLLTGEHQDFRTGKELWPELLRKTPFPAEQAGAIEKAKALLVVAMLEQGAKPSAEVFRAAEDANLSARTVQRAAEGLGITKSKAGFGGGWVWSLPEGAKVAEAGAAG